MKQTSFAGVEYAQKKKRTRREVFLTEMERVVPWSRLVGLIEPHYPKASGAGRPPVRLETMLRIHLMQQWFALSDPAMEDALYDMDSMRRFAGLELGFAALPDESTICRFRHLLERHQLGQAMFDEVRALLEAQGLLLKNGTLIDATLIAAPSSTKNADKARDPEMSQTKKGNQWHFGCKAHIGTDPQGLVHSLEVTTAKVADCTVVEELLHGEEQVVLADRGYDYPKVREALSSHGITPVIGIRRKGGEELIDEEREFNRDTSRLRAFVEHPFHTVKCVFGFVKVAYRGLAKNRAKLYTLFALANLYRARYALGA